MCWWSLNIHFLLLLIMCQHTIWVGGVSNFSLSYSVMQFCKQVWQLSAVLVSYPLYVLIGR